MSLTITKQFAFCYGHSLLKYDGKCARFHGHNSILEVTVTKSEQGPVYPYPSMVMDYKELKEMVNPILEKVDHHNLNEILGEDYFPTTNENFIKWFVTELLTVLGDRAILTKVRLTETPTSWAEWNHD